VHAACQTQKPESAVRKEIVGEALLSPSTQT
jgi:hypothetical protein